VGRGQELKGGGEEILEEGEGCKNKRGQGGKEEGGRKSVLWQALGTGGDYSGKSQRRPGGDYQYANLGWGCRGKKGGKEG